MCYYFWKPQTKRLFITVCQVVCWVSKRTNVYVMFKYTYRDDVRIGKMFSFKL